MTGPQTNGNGVGKRTMNGAAVQGSALPRVASTPRNMGTTKGMDLGTAAAAASLVSSIFPLVSPEFTTALLSKNRRRSNPESAEMIMKDGMSRKCT